MLVISRSYRLEGGRKGLNDEPVIAYEDRQLQIFATGR
jgi:hypothetical protein